MLISGKALRYHYVNLVRMSLALPKSAWVLRSAKMASGSRRGERQEKSTVAANLAS
jgi:hypothetical protein